MVVTEVVTAKRPLQALALALSLLSLSLSLSLSSLSLSLARSLIEYFLNLLDEKIEKPESHRMERPLWRS